VPQLGVPEKRRVVPTTEVMVNRPDDVFVEREGLIERDPPCTSRSACLTGMKTARKQK
jgi:hypothetical protein